MASSESPCHEGKGGPLSAGAGLLTRYLTEQHNMYMYNTIMYTVESWKAVIMHALLK